jgi:hypothetical protein
MKSLFFKFTAIALSLFLFLAGLEVAVRVLGLAQPRTGQADPVFGHALIPGQKSVNEFGVRMEIGRHGFRGPAPSPAKPEGVFRVVCLGDSFLHARAIDYDRVFHMVLNQDLAARGREVEAINLGVEAYDTAQEYMVYHHVGRKYDPDLVILFFYVGNDLAGNYPPGGRRPSFKLENGELAYVPFEIKAGRRNPIRDFFRRRVRIYSFLPDLWRAAWNNNLGQVFSAKTRHQRLERHDLQYAGQGHVVPTQKAVQTDRMSPNWQVTLALLEKLGREVEADGARFAVAVIPTMVQVYDRNWEILKEKYPDQAESWDRFRVQRILAAFCRERGFTYIPLTEHMVEAARRTGEMFYIPHDWHFNENGHAFTARVIEPYLTGPAEP